MHSRQTHQIPHPEHQRSIFWSYLMPSLPVCLCLIRLDSSDTTIILLSHLLGLAGVIWALRSVVVQRAVIVTQANIM